MVIIRISFWLDSSLPVFPMLGLQNRWSLEHFLFILPSQALSSLVRILLSVVENQFQGVSFKSSNDHLSKSVDHRLNNLGRVVLGTSACKFQVLFTLATNTKRRSLLM